MKTLYKNTKALNDRLYAKELSMAKEVKEAPIFEATGRKCSEIHFGQAVQIGINAISNINTAHLAHSSKLKSDLIYVGHGVEFKFEASPNKVVDCLVPMSVIKLIIFA